MRVRLGVLLAAACGVLSIGAAQAGAAALEPCKRAASDRACATLTVPLDRTGAVPGTVKLRIERQKAKRSTRPPLFLLAGGPGESAIGAYGQETVRRILGTEIRSRDVVVMDQRGTGMSGQIVCPELQRGSKRPRDVAACAAKLGPRRDHYSSDAAAEDIDAVRSALGADRIAIYGASYGTYLAQVYARRHPTRVERLVLDSVVASQGVDPLGRSRMAAAPGMVARLCGKRGCRSFMRDPRGDAARLAAQLDRRPLTGYVVDRDGRRRAATIDGQGLLDLLAANDSVPWLIGGLIPGAIRNALRGDPAPLLRAYADWVPHRAWLPPQRISAAAYVATLCSEAVLPWGAAGSADERQTASERLVGIQPKGAFAPFGPATALRSPVLEMCRYWPARGQSGAAVELGPLPDVPALLFAGGMDIRTPAADARAVAALMPQARVVEVGNAGHGLVDRYLDGCVPSATRRFLAGGDPGACGPGPRLSTPYPPVPLSPGEFVRGGKRRATVGAVLYTAFDAGMRTVAALLGEGLLAATPGPGRDFTSRVTTGALREGRYTVDAERPVTYVLRRAVAVPGVRVSGTLRVGEGGLVGALRVAGRAAAPGRVALRGSAVSGTLGGKRIKMRIGALLGRFGSDAGAAASPRIGPSRSWTDTSYGR